MIIGIIIGTMGKIIEIGSGMETTGITTGLERVSEQSRRLEMQRVVARQGCLGIRTIPGNRIIPTIQGSRIIRPIQDGRIIRQITQREGEISRQPVASCITFKKTM